MAEASWRFKRLVVSCIEARVRRVSEREDGTLWAWQGPDDFFGDGHVEGMLGVGDHYPAWISKEVSRHNYPTGLEVWE